MAHERRNRGATLEKTVFSFAQLAFFQTYQGTKKITFHPCGKCGWWLKPYFLGKLKTSRPECLKAQTGLSPKQAKSEILSWFPSNNPYPTRIECKNLAALLPIAKHFARSLGGGSVFSAKKVRKELYELFEIERLPPNEIPHFLVATAVLLSGRGCEVVPGFSANIVVSVGDRKIVELDNISLSEGTACKHVRFLPDGNLKVTIATNNKRGDGLLDISLDLIDTEVDTEKYFDRRLISYDDRRMIRLNLDGPLAFERAASPMVFPIS